MKLSLDFADNAIIEEIATTRINAAIVPNSGTACAVFVNPTGPVISSPTIPNPWNVTVTSIGLSSDASALSADVMC